MNVRAECHREHDFASGVSRGTRFRETTVRRNHDCTSRVSQDSGIFKRSITHIMILRAEYHGEYNFANDFVSGVSRGS